MIEITGSTRIYGIVADPVAQVKTPQTMRKVLTGVAPTGFSSPCMCRQLACEISFKPCAV
jgi:hypothetical protein